MASFPKRANAQLLGLVLFNTICHIIVSRSDYSYWIPDALQIEVGVWKPLLNFLRNSTPGLLMILAHRLFVDRRQLPRMLLGAFGLQLLLEGWLAVVPAGQSVFSDTAFQLAPAILQTAFMLIALYWTIADWQMDLVDIRRRARALVAIVIGGNVIASSLLLRIIVDPSTIANYYTHEALTLTGVGINVFVLMWISRDSISRHVILESAPAVAARPEAPAASVEPAETLARLAALMEKECVYREPGLALSMLALKVGLPEYRLRRLIHESLGYRNFNIFLHTYRIREACEMLRDPAQRRFPILTIALSVGYQSVNTFNRGFREVMGITPSEFRSGTAAPPSIDLKILTPKTE